MWETCCLSKRQPDRHIEGSGIGLQSLCPGLPSCCPFKLTPVLSGYTTIFAWENKSSKLLTGPFVLLGRGHLTEVVFNSVCTSANTVRTNLGFFNAIGIKVLTPALSCFYKRDNRSKFAFWTIGAHRIFSSTVCPQVRGHVTTCPSTSEKIKVIYLFSYNNKMK